MMISSSRERDLGRYFKAECELVLLVFVSYKHDNKLCKDITYEDI